MPYRPNMLCLFELSQLLFTLIWPLLNEDSFGKVSVWKISKTVLSLTAFEADPVHETILKNPFISDSVLVFAPHSVETIIHVSSIAYQLRIFVQGKAQTVWVGLIVECEEEVSILQYLQLKHLILRTQIFLKVVNKEGNGEFNVQHLFYQNIFILPSIWLLLHHFVNGT